MLVVNPIWDSIQAKNLLYVNFHKNLFIFTPNLFSVYFVLVPIQRLCARLRLKKFPDRCGVNFSDSFIFPRNYNILFSENKYNWEILQTGLPKLYRLFELSSVILMFLPGRSLPCLLLLKVFRKYRFNKAKSQAGSSEENIWNGSQLSSNPFQCRPYQVVAALLYAR